MSALIDDKQLSNALPVKLTSYKPGSVGELWTISYPLILTALSTNLMLVIDRLILAHYSTESMNAAVTAGVICAIFQFSTFAIASIAEVFVGQLNGAKQTHRLGEPVWQMIWFSLMTVFIFWPLALFCSALLIPAQYELEGIPYFQWIMFFGPFNPLIAALSAFFIGQGKTKLVAFAAVISNIFNVILGIILVFGVKSVLEPMGTTGAAIATCCSMVVQAGLLFIVFLNKKNRQFKGATRFAFQPTLFLNCLKISIPNALAHKIELTAWALLFDMMATMSSIHVTVAAIAQSVFILFAFLTEGLSVAITGIVANFLGSKQSALIVKTFYSALKLHGMFLLVLTIPLIFYTNLITYAFLPHPTAELYTYIQYALLAIWIFFLFDGIVWILAGILTAAGDTNYMLLMTAANVVFIVLIPTYIFIILLKGSPVTVWKIMPLYGAIHFLCYYLRYKSNRWHRGKLI